MFNLIEARRIGLDEDNARDGGRYMKFRLCFVASLFFVVSCSNAHAQLGEILKGMGDAGQRWAEQQMQLEAQRELMRQQHEFEMQRIERENNLRMQRDREQNEARQREEVRQRQAQEDERKATAVTKARQAEEERKSSIITGTGFFISTNGYLITNAHVVRDKTTYAIRDLRGQFYRAQLVSQDSGKDLALLKIDASVPALMVGDSTKVKKGQHVFAVGFPQISIQGNESKITDGIISSFSGLRDNDRWFQISVPIQGGNSGGPLVTESGMVVGVVVASVNVAKFYSTVGDLPQNVNFAIKSSVVLDFLADQRITNLVTSKGKMSIAAVDNATVLVIAKNSPIDVSYTVSPEQSAREERDRNKRAAEDGSSRAQAPEQTQVATISPNVVAIRLQGDAESERLYLLATDKNSASAQTSLGFMYANGKGGLAKDEVEALRWFRLAAAQNNAQAQINLGVMYATGRGVAKDEVEAVRWYRLAAAQNNAYAQNNLGARLLDGLGGISKDEVEALRLFRLAATQNLASAQAYLGGMYRDGRGGLAKDDVEAVRWFRLAAAQNNASAQTNLGLMYENGRGGLATSLTEAIYWHGKAAAQGNPHAKTSLARLGAN